MCPENTKIALAKEVDEEIINIPKKEDADKVKAIKRIFSDLVEYMEPLPILDRFLPSGLFESSQIQDIMDITCRSDKTRQLLIRVTRHGDVAYTALKKYLKETNQSHLVQLLEMTESREDTTEVRRELSRLFTAASRIAPKELQKDLVRYYTECRSKISVAPLMVGSEVPLEEFYVQPQMEAIDLQRRYGSPIKTPVRSYQELFFRDDHCPYKNIYVTADAGLGKTAFTRKICTTWCQAHSPLTSLASKYDDDDIFAAQYFDFLFLLPLRESDRSLCDIDEQIISSIHGNLPRRHTRETLVQILEESTCLVILDGLDEWSHTESCPRCLYDHDIPHRKQRLNWTIMSTTRSWKFDMLHLASCDVDRHVEIMELDEKSSEQLVLNAVNLLNQRVTDDRRKKSVEDFYRTTSFMKLGEIRHVPYIHLQSVCLWFEGNDIGSSKCTVYTNVLELTLSRGIQKLKRDSILVLQQEDNELNVPNCMMEKQYCIQHLSLLLKLGKLAFCTLFGTDNRQLLVIDVKVAEKYLTRQELDYCLKLGILSQNKCYGTVATKISNISFQHKSLHEYFGALYMQSNDVRSSVVGQNLINKTCTSLISILEMANVLKFLSGFRATVYSYLSQTMMKYLKLDEHAVKYRKLVGSFTDEPEYKVMFKFQTLQVEIVQEMSANGQDFQGLRIPIEDILIDEHSKHAEYLVSLQKLVLRNSVNIKSLSILKCENTEEVANVLETLDMQYLQSLEKLELQVDAKQFHIEQLLRQSINTLQYVCVNYAEYKQGRYKRKMTVLSKDCEEMVLSMPLLQGLRLSNLIVTHSQLENVTNFLTSGDSMTQIIMTNITCRDHEKSCPGVPFHLSGHGSLQLLGVHDVPISKLKVNTRNLEHCRIGSLPTSVITSWLECLPAAHNLYRLSCRNFNDSDIPTLISTIPLLLHLKELYIHHTELNDNTLYLMTEMSRFEYIQLDKVSTTSSALLSLSRTVTRLSRSVTVELYDCTVTPELEYKKVKEEIRGSNSFTVIFDGLGKYYNEFSFKTMK